MALSGHERVQRTLERYGYESADESTDGEGYYLDAPELVVDGGTSSTVLVRYAALSLPIQERRLWVDVRSTLERAGFRVQQGGDGPFLQVQWAGAASS